MIINQMKMDNFGLYAGSHELNLATTQKKPIVLIGGLNGGGKTTILDALQLCLFGGQAKTSNRNGLRYHEYLSRCIHRGNNANQASIEMNFSHTIEGNNEEFNLRRSWKQNGNGCVEKFDVSKNGVIEPSLSENWLTEVDEFFPANIANLFLFDGEQIEAYASLEDSPKLIGAAIQNLLGLDIVDQLEKDLGILDQRILKREKIDKSQMTILVVQGEKEKLEKNIISLRNELSINEKELKKVQKEYNITNEKYRNLGGDLYNQREEIEQNLENATIALEIGKQKLIEIASGSLPIVSVCKLLIEAKKADECEEEARMAQVLVDSLVERDEIVLNELRSCLNDDGIIKKMSKFLKSDRKKIAKKGNQSIVLNLNSNERDELNSFLNSKFEEVQQLSAEMLKEQEILIRNLESAQIEYENIPKFDSISSIVKEREIIECKISEYQKIIEELKFEIERKESELDRRKQELVRVVEADSNEKGEADDRKRMLHHSAKTKLTLSKFRSSIIAKHLHRIEGFVFSCYSKLLRKNALVTKISIDPKNFKLTLYDRSKREISTERLSAGERQLLAIALLWGLAMASGRPLPTAIDTPLGRLDSSHRMNMVKHYLPHASHQVLLLSTDEEISGKYLKSLEPWVGRKYHLCYDDKKGYTTITEGYLN